MSCANGWHVMNKTNDLIDREFQRRGAIYRVRPATKKQRLRPKEATRAPTPDLAGMARCYIDSSGDLQPGTSVTKLRIWSKAS
jgi:hypothetical protein